METTSPPITPVDLLKTKELEFEFIRSSGPGGQNVNKVSTAVRLRFRVFGSRILPEDVAERLVRLAGKRMTTDGELIITAQRFRTQEKNREDAMARLLALIEKAWVKPKTRRPTRPKAGAKQARLESKRQRSLTKSDRGKIMDEGD